MRGDDLLLVHLALLDVRDDADEHQPPRERLEAEIGPDLARYLIAALGRGS